MVRSPGQGSRSGAGLFILILIFINLVLIHSAPGQDTRLYSDLFILILIFINPAKRLGVFSLRSVQQRCGLKLLDQRFPFVEEEHAIPKNQPARCGNATKPPPFTRAGLDKGKR